MIRSHEPLANGYEITDSMITIFSCSDYGTSNNKSGMLHAKKNSEIAPKILNAVSTKDKWLNLEELGRKNQIMNSEEEKLRSVGFTPVKK